MGRKGRSIDYKTRNLVIFPKEEGSSNDNL